MANDEDRVKHSRRRKMNIYAKILHDQNEYKGAYSLKVMKDKTKYKRERINPREIEVDQADGDQS